MVSKLLVSLNDEPAEDDKAGDNEVEEFTWVPVEVSFRLPRNFGQPKATQIWGQPLTNKILWSALNYHGLWVSLSELKKSGQPLYKCTDASFKLNKEIELNAVGLVLRSA